ncbi:hypothetical protein IRJ41_005736 [Triplophysa rosa]|uniref:Integrase core domain-containing protein n=1 Tax=Triplophysa rosa TaxID=992332 RepID=A0A9W8C7J9_TRIRA|nr:hypothetical protein IRJ41_005736 [Triplophysa rosa]
MKEYDLSVRKTYSTIKDTELDNVISAIKSQMPNAGYRMVQGHLVSMGLRVQWRRMMASMHRVDTVGIFARITQLGCVVRRSYSVRGPLSLVHIDTNHKLIRIERLWRDVWMAVTSKYYDVLHSLVEDGLLDISNILHIFAVHYIFLPRIKVDLDSFIGGWNDHPLRTAGNLTPEQMWLLGDLQHLEEQESLQELQDPGIDWESAVLQEDPTGAVVVPEIECPLDEQSFDDLQRDINPLSYFPSHA